MRYLSLFSGVECASLAWEELGWEPVAFAEVDRFPSAVLTHRWPHVPNLGDVTRVTDAQVRALGRIDLVVGGFPCQDLSVAGQRRGLIDEETGEKTRSGLFFDAMRIVRASGARFLLLENVPGIYSSNGGDDFAAVVAEILGCRFGVPEGGWRNTGCAASERGLLEWCTLDAQWFGVPQRRRRFFALADFGDWWNRPPILVEPGSLFRDYPARPGQGQAAPTIPARRTGGGGIGTDFDCGGGLIPDVCGTIPAAGGTDRKHGQGWGQREFEAGGFIIPVQVFGGNNTSGSIEVSPRLGCNDSGSGYRLDFGSDAMVVHALRADGFDASEDGTGRGTPLVVQSVAMRGREGGATAELSGEVATALRASQGGGDKPHVLAPVAVNPYQRTVSDVASPCTAGDSKRMACGVMTSVYAIQSGAFRENPVSGPGGVGVQEGVAYTIEAREEVQSVVYPSLGAKNPTAVATGMRVRRLMPIECERLQGMPDNHTRIPVRTFKKRPETRHFLRYRDLYEKDQDGTWTRHAADGPRYKAVGNGMAVPVMRWIGRRIDWVWRMIGQERAA